MEEKVFYNALNIFYNGDYFKLNRAGDNYGSWQKAWEEIGINSDLNINEAWNKLTSQEINLTLQSENDFPELFKEIPWPPLGIYWKGEVLDNQPKIAIVGTRKATLSGRTIAKNFASVIAANGVGVVSGLALGIDSAAHEGALENNGKTIAVLANGLDYVYPKQNENLFKKILKSKGTVASEYPFGPPAYSSRFLERNRIISGLSLGVIIIEAPIDSGALATARFALEQNREVFVIPGPINHFNYVGSHNLIKSGASLTTSPEEVLAALNLANIAGDTGGSHAKILEFLTEDQKIIVKILKEAGQPLTIDKIKELSRMEISAVNRIVSLLQIQDIIKEERGLYYL